MFAGCADGTPHQVLKIRCFVGIWDSRAHHWPQAWPEVGNGRHRAGKIRKVCYNESLMNFMMFIQLFSSSFLVLHSVAWTSEGFAVKAT